MKQHDGYPIQRLLHIMVSLLLKIMDLQILKLAMEAVFMVITCILITLIPIKEKIIQNFNKHIQVQLLMDIIDL